MTDRNPICSSTCPPGSRNRAGSTLLNTASTSSDGAGRAPNSVGVVGVVTLYLLGPLDHLRIRVRNGDRGPVTPSVDGNHDRAPLGELGYHRLRHALNDLTCVDRVGQHIVDLGEILDAFALTPFDLQQPRSFLDLAMAFVDVDREPKRSDHFAADFGHDHITDAFDPMDASVRPGNAMVEPEWLAAFHAALNGALNHLTVSFVERLDPAVERSAERAVGDTEQHRNVRVPCDLACSTIPAPLPHTTGGQCCLESIRTAHDRQRLGKLAIPGRSRTSGPHRECAAQDSRENSDPMTSAPPDSVRPPKRYGDGCSDRRDGECPPLCSTRRHQRSEHQ